MTIIKNQIYLHELPTGKQTFIATVDEITEELEINYHGYDISVPYIYLKNIKILIDKTWYDVECSGNMVRSKIGKRLEKLNLEEEDIISFDSQVEKKGICFWHKEGERVEPSDSLHDYNYTALENFLPEKYDGEIGVEIYKTAFNRYGRLWKDNKFLIFDRKTFDRDVNKLNSKREATKNVYGYFCEVQRKFFWGRILKNFSNIEKF